MCKKKLPGSLLRKTLFSAHRVLAKRTSGSIKRTDSALDPPALFQLGFLASPGSIMKVPSTFSANIQHLACIHTPYWKEKLLARLPGFSGTCSSLLRNLSRSSIDIITLETSHFGQVSLAEVNPRHLIFCCTLFSAAAAFPKTKKIKSIHYFQCSCFAPRWLLDGSHTWQRAATEPSLPPSTHLIISRSIFPQVSLYKTGHTNLTAVSLIDRLQLQYQIYFRPPLYIKSLVIVNGKSIHLFNN